MKYAIIARLAGLETLVAGCLAFLLDSAGNDPDLSKAKAILDALNVEADRGFEHLPAKIQAEAKFYVASVTKRCCRTSKSFVGRPRASSSGEARSAFRAHVFAALRNQSKQGRQPRFGLPRSEPGSLGDAQPPQSRQ